MPAAHGHTKVLLIAGLGRSGSTLLGRVCGQLPGFANVGELGQFWRNGFIDDVLCGCGQPIRACEFWRAVVGVAFGGFDRLPASTVRTLTDFWDTLRRLAARLALSLPLRAAQRGALATYTEHVVRVVDAVRTVSGCRVVVDTSKTPAHLIALAGSPAIELHVVHLVRDSRAVAHSWQQRRRRRQLYRAEAYIEPVRPQQTALLWNGINILTWLVRKRASSYARLRYEDFARAPDEVVAALLRRLGEAPDPAVPEPPARPAVAQHTVAGNPVRFDHVASEIRLDAAWEHAMPLGAQLTVTALTWPLLLACNYPLFAPVLARVRAQWARLPS